MWELIKANQRKSIILFIALALCLFVLGYFAGAAIYPPTGGINGLFIAIIIWIVMSIISVFGGKSIILASSHAKEVTHDMYPQLFNVVEEMKIASNLPVMPKVYIMYNSSPNAFATGLNIKNSAIVVTTGLLERLKRDELQGVVAHEMSHIINRDVQFMTLAGVMLGTITILAEVFLRGMFYSSLGRSRRYSSRSAGGGQAQLIIILVAIAVAILAPILAQIFYFAISRKREYLADASAARLTRYPEGLASALEKISSGILPLKKDEKSGVNKITAPMYIINPLQIKKMSASSFSSTHPPTAERIRILRNMMAGAGANYTDYQRAYEQVNQKKEPLIPASGLSDKDRISVRAASKDSGVQHAVKPGTRNIGDLLRAANGFIFLSCICGMKIKLPPNFKKSSINCPRCKRNIEVPIADMIAMGAAIDQAVASSPAKQVLGVNGQNERMIYKRKGSGWESVQCKCGHMFQISPMFLGSNMKCPKCSRVLDIE